MCVFVCVKIGVFVFAAITEVLQHGHDYPPAELNEL